MAYATTRRKKTLTPEQEDASRQRREAIKAIATQLTNMSEAERIGLAAQHPVTTCEGRQLSAYNNCLVISQQADATIVGGFHQWRAVGRKVRTGGKGCAIFVPAKPGKDREIDHKLPDERRFQMVYVYDITMTEEYTDSV